MRSQNKEIVGSESEEALWYHGLGEDTPDDLRFHVERLVLEKYRERFLELVSNEYEVSYPPHIVVDIPFELDVSRDLESISNGLDKFKEFVLARAKSYKDDIAKNFPTTIIDVPRDGRRRPKNFKELTAMLDMALKAYQIGKSHKNYCEVIASDLLHADGGNVRAWNSACKKAERYYKKAQRLIDAAKQGTFPEELNNPL